MALRAEIAARGIISSDNEYTITAAIVIGCPSKQKQKYLLINLRNNTSEDTYIGV